jgi:hypothetical protein
VKFENLFVPSRLRGKDFVVLRKFMVPAEMFKE